MKENKRKNPTKEELFEARNKTLADLLSPGLKVIFCGINPGLYSAAVQHHFARPGNRFWPALYRSGFTPRLFSPDEEKKLLTYGLGLTNIVNRATASADELSREELLRGGEQLREKVKKYKPISLAVLGLGAFRTAFDSREAGLGLQEKTISGTALWVLPSPSGINASYRIEDLVRCLEELRNWVQERSQSR